jgi:hypothetical protein
MHRRRRLLVVFTAVALGSCGGDSAPESTVAVTSRTDTQIAELLYAGVTRTPDGFLADPVPPAYQQVTTLHIKSNQLDASAVTSFEVCTDDFAEALAWSETLALAAPAYLNLVDSSQGGRYFEFDRVANAEPERLVRMRVYRCAYLDRSGVALGSTTEAAGTLNTRPVDAVAMRELGEYLWRFTTYNNADHAVLGSEARGTATIEHVLTLASLARGAGAGGCDRVTLHEWQHTADPATGVLGHDDVALRAFDVRRNAGVVSGC